MSIRILIADDDLPIRRLIRRILEEHSEWDVCGEAENGRDAVAKAKALCPDLIVMDLAMPLMNGLQAAKEIRAATPTVPMLLLTVQEVSTELVSEARKVGFVGAVSKSSGSEVVAGIESILREHRHLNSSEIPA